MSATNTDLLRKLSRRWVSQIGSGGVADAVATTIPLSSTTNLPTDTAVTLVIDRVDANGTATPTSEETIVGVVSGTNIVNAVRGVEGTAQAHSAGAVVEVLVTADGYNDIIDHLLVEHGQDGKHKSALVTTLKATGAEINTGTEDAKIVTPKAIADSAVSTASKTETLTNKTLTSPKINEDVALTATATQLNAQVLASNDGWISANETWTYVSADDPTFTFKIAGVDLTTKYSAGMRIKLTQTTVKYFIITAVAFSTDTTITVYGGTDYNLDDAAISLNYYSTQKAPQGFPLDPSKWSVIVTDASNRTQLNPTQNVWYNLGTTNSQISIPIGVWSVSYNVSVYCDRGSAGGTGVYATLHTANNAETALYTTASIQTAGTALAVQMSKQFILVLASKTLYYLNAKTDQSSISGLALINASNNLILSATCAYL